MHIAVLEVQASFHHSLPLSLLSSLCTRQEYLPQGNLIQSKFTMPQEKKNLDWNIDSIPNVAYIAYIYIQESWHTRWVCNTNPRNIDIVYILIHLKSFEWVDCVVKLYAFIWKVMGSNPNLSSIFSYNNKGNLAISGEDQKITAISSSHLIE